MSYNKYILASLMLSASTAVASNMNSFVKRDSWGAAFSLGPSKHEIIQTTTTIYPGKMPSDQKAYLFAWLGISNGTGDLIQFYYTTWCISSEVYGSGYQYVGDLTTADLDYENGIKLNYTLVDSETYLWTQTMSDAVTGKLLSSYNKTSGPMTGWGTALECDNNNGVSCTGTDQHQYYFDSTIILKAADSTFSSTLGAGTGVTHTEMETADGGITWTIAKIAIPPMVTNAETAAEVTPGVIASSASPSVVASSSTASVSHAAVTVPASATSAPVHSTKVSSSTFATSVKPSATASSSSTGANDVSPAFSRPTGFFRGGKGFGRGPFRGHWGGN
ncbi:hypothetical protein EYC84_006518 [Monilinia fructicola]|uniref:Uncharacterized protein n=1 Tax=Monilinia fructicola TaxID=38448 RepID=A0A5M9K6D3_MONFR|nr:hypothetical protein EYC84_006518 [Monilinia fructicola]